MRLLFKDHKVLPNAKEFTMYIEQYEIRGVVEHFADVLIYTSLYIMIPVENSRQEPLEIQESGFKNLINSWCEVGKIKAKDCDSLFKTFFIENMEEV